MTELDLEPHALLRTAAFVTIFGEALGDVASPPALLRLLHADAEAPLMRDEDVRTAVRDMLRLHGYKPTGRGKPASEYLVKAASDGIPTINRAVDACNVVSLHSGLPISVIDLDRAVPPARIGVAAKGERYLFNASGQEIDVSGLPCIFDTDGPCANAVKDSQRTKTHDGTRRTLSVIWGCAGHEARLEAATAWYRSLLESMGARTEDVRAT
jgi:DNA/RNA-binding domain of Phe-tRNA-synthetase-like protein